MSRLFDRLAPEQVLTRRDRSFGLVWLMRNGISTQAMETLTIGPFLVAYALLLGASNFHIGLLAAVPHLAQLAQLLGVYLVERVRARRFICVMAGAFSRPMLLIAAAAAFLPPPTLALAALTLAVAGRYAFGAIVGASWNSWVRDLVPEARMGRFFANRLLLMTLVGMVLSLAAPAFVDQWGTRVPEHKTYAYAILFGVAFLCGSFSVYCMVRMPDPGMPGPAVAHDSGRLEPAREYAGTARVGSDRRPVQ